MPQGVTQKSKTKQNQNDLCKKQLYSLHSDASRRIRSACSLERGGSYSGSLLRWSTTDFPNSVTSAGLSGGWKSNRALFSENRKVVGVESQTSRSVSHLVSHPTISEPASLAIGRKKSRGPSLSSSVVNHIGPISWVSLNLLRANTTSSGKGSV